MSRVRTLRLPVGLSLPAALSLVLLSACGSCGEQPAPVPEVVEAPAEVEEAAPWPHSWQWAAVVHVAADADGVEVLDFSAGDEEAPAEQATPEPASAEAAETDEPLAIPAGDEEEAAGEDAADEPAAEEPAAEEPAAEDPAAEEPAADPASTLRIALAEAPVAAFRAPAGAALTLTPPAQDDGATPAPVTVEAPALAEGETEAWFLVTDEGTHRLAAADADGLAREARLALGLDPWKIIVGVGVDHAPGQRAGREDLVTARLAAAGIDYRDVAPGTARLAVPFDGEGQRALADLDLAGLIEAAGGLGESGVFVMAMAGKEPLVIPADPPVMLLRKGTGYFEAQLHPQGMGPGQGRGKGMKAGKGPGGGKGMKAGRGQGMRGEGMRGEGMRGEGMRGEGKGRKAGRVPGEGPVRGKGMKLRQRQGAGAGEESGDE